MLRKCSSRPSLQFASASISIKLGASLELMPCCGLDTSPYLILFPNRPRQTPLALEQIPIFLLATADLGSIPSWRKPTVTAARSTRFAYLTWFRESQYRHWFNKWGVRRRILVAEKDQIVAALGKRARPGESTSNVTLNSDNADKAVDKKQLKRYLKDQIRHHQVEPMWPGV